MVNKYPMRHLVILLPGIMGSVLQKNGKDVWALSGQALWQYLGSRLAAGNSLQALQVVAEDWGRDDLGDGIVAARLIEDLHAIPGLAQHAGYSPICQRIAEYFDVTEGSIHAPSDDANFYPFPYDWRRDNRATARHLQRFIAQQLPRWRDWSGAQDAQVILLAHSMGGLSARYYIEVLGGWSDCLALVTVGTPHRGSVNALNMLSNGVKNEILGIDLSEVVRSFASAYQLLPTYPIVQIDGVYKRVAETDKIRNVNQNRAKAAHEEFLLKIREAALQNRSLSNYRQCTIPWVGTRQDTYQSAILDGDTITLSYHPPAGLDRTLADGDGTVPRVSATPVDLDGQRYERYAIEQHGWLTNNMMTLDPLLDTLVQIVASGTENLFGGVEVTRPALNLRVDPLYDAEEPAKVRIAVVNAVQQSYPLELRLEPVGHPGDQVIKPMVANGPEPVDVNLVGLSPGLYRVEVAPPIVSQTTPIDRKSVV